MAGSDAGIVRGLIRRRGWIVAAWTLALVVLLPAARRLEGELEVAARIPGSESAAVEEELARRFGSPFAHYAILVVRGVPGPDHPIGRAELDRLLASLREVPGVTGTFSYRDAPDPLFVARDGTFVVVGLDASRGPVDALIPRVRSASAALLPELRARFPEATLRWTGEVALNTDLRQTSAAQAQAAERRVAPLTLLLLLLAFGTLAAASLPVVTGFLAIPLALGVAALLTRVWPLSILLVNVVSMIGLGLGIDYGLLVVSRFREGLAGGMDARGAAEAALREAGHTVLMSGAAVAVGFGALLWVPLNEIRSIAVGGLLVTAISVLLATTLLPGLLVWLGPRIDVGRLWKTGRRDPGRRWRAWGGWVARRPLRVLLLAGAPVVWLALQGLRLSTDLPRGDWLPPRMESARALHDLQEMGKGGVVQTIRVVLELPEGTGALQPQGWIATRRLGVVLAADRRIARVQSLPAMLGGDHPNPELFARLPSGVVRSFVSSDRQAALLELLPAEEVESEDLSRLVREIRALDAATVTGIAGARLRVGGLPALNADYQGTISGRFPGVLLLVLGGTLVALALGFRSVLIPLKAIALNLLSVGAAMGAVVLVFQDGLGASLLGLDGPTHGVFPAIPILVFCTVFGLSMDYEVFLVARVAEARRAGMSESAALAEGLARTGGVITSAAAIMIAVFGAFTLGEFLLIKMLGLALAVAVLVDATVIRLAIGPALLRLAGEWNWWPGNRRERVAARVRAAARTSSGREEYVPARMQRARMARYP